MARQYNWSPFEIEKLRVDDIDYLGIFYWYQDSLDYINEIKTKQTKPE